MLGLPLNGPETAHNLDLAAKPNLNLAASHATTSAPTPYLAASHGLLQPKRIFMDPSTKILIHCKGPATGNNFIPIRALNARLSGQPPQVSIRSGQEVAGVRVPQAAAFAAARSVRQDAGTVGVAAVLE